jgi:hypothetical protein
MKYVILWTPLEIDPGISNDIVSCSLPPYSQGKAGIHPVIPWSDMDEAEILAWSVGKQVGKDADGNTLPYRLVEWDTYYAEPFWSDRTFRNAWSPLNPVTGEPDTIDNDVNVYMPKARAIHMDKIRVVRNAELAAKDITFMRAVESGDTDAQATIGTEKQTLRDIPQTFDLTTDNDTPEELKAKWPTELPARE